MGIHLINNEEKNSPVPTVSGVVSGPNVPGVSPSRKSLTRRFGTRMRATIRRMSRWPRSMVSLGIAGISVAGTAAIVHAHHVHQQPAQTLQPLSQSAPVLAKNTPGKHLHKAISNPLRGLASWYGSVLHGHPTASGEIFDETKMTACHNSLPFGTRVRVTDVNSKKSVVVRINDRGVLSPGRVIDLSSGAAERLGILRAGIATVRVDVLKGVSGDLDVD